MKKTLGAIIRKHGHKARATLAKPQVRADNDCRDAGLAGPRLKTLLTFESQSQAYLWITDRGRSRLIKH